MHGCIRKGLAGMLAVAVSYGAAAMVMGQETMAPVPTTDAAYGYLEPPSEMVMATNVANVDEGDLAKRLTEIEKALKKSDDKAKEDKKKAAEKPTVSVFGRLFLDTAAFGQNAESQSIYGDAKDATYFRSARIGVMGDMFDVMSYVWEMDFAARDPQDLSVIAFRNTYLQIKDLPWLDKVRVGHFKEPLSLEQLTSSRFTTFMERSMSDIFVPAYSMGVMTLSNTEDERATWAIGGFAAGQDTPPYVLEDSALSGDGTAGTVRGTWTPWYDEATQGRGLFHVGMGYRYENLTASTQRLRAHPEVAAGPYVVDTRIGLADTLTGCQSVQTAVPEIAFLYGPFSVQAEYMASTYARDSGRSDPTFKGGYIYAGYFLTGENRGYNRKEGRFDRVKPYENFFRVCDEDGQVATGKGAWELAYRYSWIDLNQGGIAGGMASDHTFGLNWYLTPYSRVMLNYVHSVDSPNNDRSDTFIDALMMRAQYDF
ncbi:MAG: OprO/OprP family phosphate-selective porin [Pirellulaceae bacterium]